MTKQPKRIQTPSIQHHWFRNGIPDASSEANTNTGQLLERILASLMFDSA